MRDPRPTRRCAVSVDLDEIGCYRALHSLPAIAAGATAVYDVALERIRAFALATEIPLTLFAVGRDLERGSAADAVRSLARQGHHVENHSYHHHYRLMGSSRAEVREDVSRAHEAILEITGRAPQGFRAPGYAVRDRLFETLEELEYCYDSSVFPCPLYYGAKALVLAAQRLGGRTSAAILDSPRVLLAPKRPYRPARPWYRQGGSGVLELPISVTPILGVPFIGTSLVLAGERGARRLTRLMAAEPFINIELHGIDFLVPEDGLGDLAPRQPDLRRSLGVKLRALQAVVEVLRHAGYRFVRLADAAAELA